MTAANKIGYEFIYEFLFSIAVVALISNLVLLVRIKFGSYVITHLSLRPYIVSLALLVTMVTEFSTMSIIQAVAYK